MCKGAEVAVPCRHSTKGCCCHAGTAPVITEAVTAVVHQLVNMQLEMKRETGRVVLIISLVWPLLAHVSPLACRVLYSACLMASPAIWCLTLLLIHACKSFVQSCSTRA